MITTLISLIALTAVNKIISNFSMKRLHPSLVKYDRKSGTAQVIDAETKLTEKLNKDYAFLF